MRDHYNRSPEAGLAEIYTVSYALFIAISICNYNTVKRSVVAADEYISELIEEGEKYNNTKTRAELTYEVVGQLRDGKLASLLL